MWSIKIKAGKDTEEILLTDEEYEAFESSNKEAKRSFDLIPLGRGRTCAKGDIISASEAIEKDEIGETLTV
jgi:hypothetical protein